MGAPQRLYPLTQIDFMTTNNDHDNDDKKKKNMNIHWKTNNAPARFQVAVSILIFVYIIYIVVVVLIFVAEIFVAMRCGLFWHGWEQQRSDPQNVTGAGHEWWYHWKADVSQGALVPTLIPMDMEIGELDEIQGIIMHAERTNNLIVSPKKFTYDTHRQSCKQKRQ